MGALSREHCADYSTAGVQQKTESGQMRETKILQCCSESSLWIAVVVMNATCSEVVQSGHKLQVWLDFCGCGLTACTAINSLQSASR